MKIKKFICIFLITPTILYSLTKNEQPEQQDIPTISMAYSWVYGFKNILDEYKESVSDQFILETERNIGLNHQQKILVDISSNTIPDVFCFWSYETNLKYMADNGFLLDIDEYFKETDTVKREDFYTHSLESTEIDGINYAIPYEQFLGFFAVNKSILDQYDIPIPKYWSDFNKMSPILNRAGIVPLSMGSFRGDPGHLFYSALAYQHPEGYKDTQEMKTNYIFDTTGNRLAANAIMDLIKYKAIPSNTIYEGSFDRQIELYNKSKAASIFTFSWELALFDKEIAEKTIIIPVPRINSSSLDTSTFTIGGTAQSLCISKKAWNDPKKREAIINLVDWLLSDEIFEIKMNQSGCFPTKRMELPINDNPIYEKVSAYSSDIEILGIHEFFFNSISTFNQYKEANDLLWSGAVDTDEFIIMVQESMTSYE